MCSYTALVEECIFCWCIGRGFNFPVKMLRDAFAITKFYGVRKVFHCPNLHIGGKGICIAWECGKFGMKIYNRI